ncbi:MAG: IS3 family transposase [Nautiliaceae bacterium]
MKVKTACELFEIPRSSFYFFLSRGENTKDLELIEKIKKIAYDHSGIGCRKITYILRREGWKVNHKKVYRLYKELDLGNRQKSRRKKKVSRDKEYKKPEAGFVNDLWSLNMYLSL